MSAYQSSYTGAEIDTAIANMRNIIDIVYPVGAIYISTNSINPSTYMGGTWTPIRGKFLLSEDTTHDAGTNGGSSIHTHDYGIQFGAYYSALSIENNPQGYVLAYNEDGTFSAGTNIAHGSYTGNVNNAVTNANKEVSMTHRLLRGNTSYTSNYPPYLSVYMWERTA